MRIKLLGMIVFLAISMAACGDDEETIEKARIEAEAKQKKAAADAAAVKKADDAKKKAAADAAAKKAATEKAAADKKVADEKAAADKKAADEKAAADAAAKAAQQNLPAAATTALTANQAGLTNGAPVQRLYVRDYANTLFQPNTSGIIGNANWQTQLNTDYTRIEGLCNGSNTTNCPVNDYQLFVGSGTQLGGQLFNQFQTASPNYLVCGGDFNNYWGGFVQGGWLNEIAVVINVAVFWNGQMINNSTYTQGDYAPVLIHHVMQAFQQAYANAISQNQCYTPPVAQPPVVVPQYPTNQQPVYYPSCNCNQTSGTVYGTGTIYGGAYSGTYNANNAIVGGATVGGNSSGGLSWGVSIGGNHSW